MRNEHNPLPWIEYKVKNSRKVINYDLNLKKAMGFNDRTETNKISRPV